MSSERQALLPLRDSEAGTADRGDEISWREKTAILLETPTLHKTVISLITVDAVSVFVELGYTFLSPTCEPGGPDAPGWLEILALISLVITTLFLIEIPLALWAFGLQYYNPFGQVPHAILHLADAAIIITTFVLEVALKGKERELASLLIILRLWRLVKLVGGVAVGAGELEEANAKELADITKELKSTRADLRAALSENGELRRRLASLE